MNNDHQAASERTVALARVITLWPLAFYGLGVIVGAGIYVATGDVIARAGDRAPLSFLIAGVAALLTGLCYAELAGRFPEAAGAGAFIAFFAFIGFETMANLGEEVKNPRRTLPLGIIIAVAVSVVLYVAVAAAAVVSGSTGDLPLLNLFEGKAAPGFALIGAIAISNGVLVEIVMLSRLFYGMSNTGQLPAFIGAVNSRTQTPVIATIVAGIIILVTAALVPFERLLVLANALTLLIFIVVDLALLVVHRSPSPGERSFVAPRWVPPAGAGLAFALIAAEFLP